MANRNTKLGGSDWTYKEILRSNDLNDTFDAVVENSGSLIPIGTVFSWLKNFPNVPPIGDEWVECNGQVLNDPDSILNGQIIPDLNGQNRFLQGSATSGSVGGSATMTHTHTGSLPSGSSQGDRPKSNSGSWSAWEPFFTTDGASNTENRPPFYTVVWIMKIK
jgi:hypothetical protein